MKLNSKVVCVLASVLLTTACWAAPVRPGESIVRDPATGNYTITYRGDPNSTELSQTIFVHSTKIEPTIHSSFRMGERGIMYRYRVTNGALAKQSIILVILEQVINPIIGEIPFPHGAVTQISLDAYHAAEKAAIASPAGWYGEFARRQSEIDWTSKPGTFNTNGIKSGRSLSGLGFNSYDLPGVGGSKIFGLGEVLGFPDEGPIESSAVLVQLNQLRDNDFVRRNAAVPSIVVPVPFDAATLLDRIRTHFLTWQGKQLVEPAFASQLDRYLVAATEAFRRNQIKAGKEHLETIHELLEKEHKHLDGDDDSEAEKQDKEHRTATRPNIDRLAARVLDFDVKYVLKRLEEGKERAEKKRD